MAHYAWVHAKSLQSCPTLCNPMDCSLPSFSVHGILQARILEWVVMPSPPGNDPGIKPLYLMSPALSGRFFTTSTTWEAPILVISRCKTPKVHGALCQPFFPPQQEPPSVPQATLRPFFPPPCLPLEAAWAPVLS